MIRKEEMRKKWREARKVASTGQTITRSNIYGHVVQSVISVASGAAVLIISPSIGVLPACILCFTLGAIAHLIFTVCTRVEPVPAAPGTINSVEWSLKVQLGATALSVTLSGVSQVRPNEIVQVEEVGGAGSTRLVTRDDYRTRDRGHDELELSAGENPTASWESKCVIRHWVSEHECPNYTAGDGQGAGGGGILKICGEVNSRTGHVSIRVTKKDGSKFGQRDFHVRMSEVGNGPCGPDAAYVIVADRIPNIIGDVDELSFDFQPVATKGESRTRTAYCVTASTAPADPGYDAKDLRQRAWWWSDKVIVDQACE